MATQSTPEEVFLLSSGKNVLGPPATANRKARGTGKGFLAGEAQPLEIPDDVSDGFREIASPKTESRSGKSPATASFRSFVRVQQDLEKRPDSSRERLGLRASMIIGTEDVPWATPGNASVASYNSHADMSSHLSHTSKGLGLFMKDI